MKLVPTNEKVQIQWFVVVDGQKYPKKTGMVGYKAFEVKCSCGWESNTGGGVFSWVKSEADDHKLIDHNYEWDFSFDQERRNQISAMIEQDRQKRLDEMVGA